jgi:hypothetical protein
MAESWNADFELLPALEEDLTADEELDRVLGALRLPDAPEDDTADEEVGPLAVGRSWAFDWERGQFLRSGEAPRGVSGLEALKVWIIKTLLVTRGQLAIYSDTYGLDDINAFGRPYDTGVAAAWSDAIESALLVHDRIASIENTSFDYDPLDDAVLVSFTVVTDTDELVDIQEVALT